jgi:hypothetical protein
MSHALGIGKNSRAKVRLFYTDQPTPCADDPELFFNARAHRLAIVQCRTCPFRGRCGYNAVAVGATHGIWGGIMFPGDYPSKLAPIYARASRAIQPTTKPRTRRYRDDPARRSLTPLKPRGLRGSGSRPFGRSRPPPTKHDVGPRPPRSRW